MIAATISSSFLATQPFVHQSRKHGRISFILFYRNCSLQVTIFVFHVLQYANVCDSNILSSPHLLAEYGGVDMYVLAVCRAICIVAVFADC